MQTPTYWTMTSLQTASSALDRVANDNQEDAELASLASDARAMLARYAELYARETRAAAPRTLPSSTPLSDALARSRARVSGGA